MGNSSSNDLPVIGIVSRKDSSEMWPGYALYGQGASYVRSVALAGGAPVIIPLELQERAWRRIYEGLDGLLFPGGVDINPAYYDQQLHQRLGRVDDRLDEAELVLAGWALQDHLPTLAICRGIQLINVAAGGSLYQDIPTQLPDAFPHACSAPTYPREYRAHPVRIKDGSRLAAAMDATTCRVNSRHHQCVRDLAPDFQATARAPDGVIEAIEHKNAPFMVGVQWHPESLAEQDPQMLAIFEAFVEASCQ